MKDTPAHVDRMYRNMLLARSGEERLRMGFSMYATARAFVLAAIREREPAASPARVREGLFVRFYGHEFGAEERERILRALGNRRRQGEDAT
jgi:hypothetical protein